MLMSKYGKREAMMLAQAEGFPRRRGEESDAGISGTGGGRALRIVLSNRYAAYWSYVGAGKVSYGLYLSYRYQFV